MNIVQTQLNISRVLGQRLAIPETAAKILDLLCRINNFQVCAWYQPDERGTFRLFELTLAESEAHAHVPIFEGIVPQRVSAKFDAINSNKNQPSTSAQNSLLPALRIPLQDSQGKILAVIECFSFACFEPTPDWLMFVESMSLQIGQYLQESLDKQRQDNTATIFEMFSRQTNEAFWICNSRFDKLFYVSPMFADILGCSLDELYDDLNAYRTYTHPDDRALLQEAARKVKNFPEGLDVDYRIVRPDKTVRWIAARWTPIFNKHGKVEKVCGFARDLTKKKEAEARVSEFYSTVSHELRTPLTSIKGALGVIGGGLVGEINQSASHLVSIATDETDRLIRLINGFLDLRKIELGKTELHLTSILSDELIGAVVTSLGPLADQSGVSFKPLLKDKVRVKCDKDRIVQVLTNFVSNALKFSGQGQCIELACEAKNNRVRFEVRDHGPGISCRDREKLFAIFQQIDCEITRKSGGSGLGLAISKSLIELHGGKIGVDSVVGKGSTFWFELPQLATVQSSYRNLV